MATAVKKLDLKIGELVEVGGRRYEVVPDRQGGLTPRDFAQTKAAIRLDRLRHRGVGAGGKTLTSVMNRTCKVAA